MSVKYFTMKYAAANPSRIGMPPQKHMVTKIVFTQLAYPLDILNYGFVYTLFRWI